MLRWMVGEEVFWDIFPAYADAYRYGNATIPEFKDICERVSGEELDWFFDQWIYQAGHPEYEFVWVVEDSGAKGYLTTTYIRQTQVNAPIFKMPAELALVTADSVFCHRVMVEDTVENFQFCTDSEPVEVQFDRNNWILKKLTTITAPIVSYRAHIVEGTTSFGDVGGYEFGDNSGNPFSFSVDIASNSHVATFFLRVSAEGGYETTVSFLVNIGPSLALVVDDDGGKSFESYYTASVGKIVPYDVWEVSTQGVPDSLMNYQAVVWFTGDDSISALTADEQSVLTSFLQDGGNLFISGQDIGFDLVEDGSPQDSAFYSEFLHAHYLSNRSDCDAIRGVSGDAISGEFANSLLLISSDGGASYLRSPSVIAPANGAVAIFNYLWGPFGTEKDSTGAALRYEGNDRLIYQAFGFEAINAPVDRDHLMARAIGWLLGCSDVEEWNGASLTPPRQCHLAQNFPNPFNPITEITYALPKESHVNLEIYNLLGQRVATVVDERQQAGYRSVRWDASPFSSGIYFYRLQAGDFVETRKMILLR